MSTNTTYRERLTPGAWIWLLAPAMGVMTGFAMGPLGTPAAIAAGIVAAAALLAWGYLGAARIEIADGELRAGRARIPVSMLGEAQTAAGDQATAERGPRADHRAFLLLRSWIDPVVKVQVLDDDDPTPYWLLSSRRPQALAQALRTAQGSDQ